MPGIPGLKLIERRLSRFLREPVSVRNALSVIVTTTLAVVLVSGVAIRALDPDEYSSVWEGMWWALQTVTTVGYGDVTPTTVAGRFVAAVVMLEGVAFLAIITAAITSSFVARAQRGSAPTMRRRTISPQSVSMPGLTTSPRAWTGSSRCSARSASTRALRAVADDSPGGAEPAVTGLGA